MMTTTTLSAWQKIKMALWLVLGLGCLFFTFVLWIIQSQKTSVKEIPIEVESQVARPVQMEVVAANEHLGDFNDEVPPLDQAKREAVAGEHEPEFRGLRFIAEHNKQWTLQLMKVSEEEIIRTYLSKREDRNKFQYFRLQDGKKAAQFVLSYGIYKDVKQTIDQTQNIDFALPESVKALPEKFSTYAALVNDLGSDELAQGTQLRSVILTKAARPKMVDLMSSPPPSVTNPLAGTTTTIQRKDESGDIKSTHTERSQVKPKVDTPPAAAQDSKVTPTTPNRQDIQIIDPF